MTIEEAVAALDALKGDPEEAHASADAILLKFLSEEGSQKRVAEAYMRLRGRCSWWAYA